MYLCLIILNYTELIIWYFLLNIIYIVWWSFLIFSKSFSTINTCFSFVQYEILCLHCFFFATRIKTIIISITKKQFCNISIYRADLSNQPQQSQCSTQSQLQITQFRVIWGPAPVSPAGGCSMRAMRAMALCVGFQSARNRTQIKIIMMLHRAHGGSGRAEDATHRTVCVCFCGHNSTTCFCVTFVVGYCVVWH